MDSSQHMTEDQRAEAFREFQADQMRKQTKSLDTIRTLMILWFVLSILGAFFLVAGAMAAGSSGF